MRVHIAFVGLLLQLADWMSWCWSRRFSRIAFMLFCWRDIRNLDVQQFIQRCSLRWVGLNGFQLRLVVGALLQPAHFATL